MINGIIIIIIAILLEIVALWSLGWNPFKYLKDAKTSGHKFGCIATFSIWALITIGVIFFIVQGILLI